MRWLPCLALVGVLAACGPGDDLPPSVPTVHLDAGAQDGGPRFAAACADAGCADLDRCEPLADAGVACGRICGNACGSMALCTPARCHDLDAGAWGDAVCTNGSGSKMWSLDPTCDDGNPCHAHSACFMGACVATAAAPTTTACDDGNVCTTGDHCDGSGGCGGAAVSGPLYDRYYHDGSGVTVTNYAYGPHANASWWTSMAGYSQQSSIYASVPGGETIHECRLQSGSFDRILLLDTSDKGNYTCDCDDSNCDTGQGASTHLPGTVPLRRFTFSAGHPACGGQTPCNYYTTGAGPGGATAQSTTIWVCPP